jgi:hypothetical protein
VENLQKDPWVNMVKDVMSRSRASLNTIHEDDSKFISLSCLPLFIVRYCLFGTFVTLHKISFEFVSFIGM